MISLIYLKLYFDVYLAPGSTSPVAELGTTRLKPSMREWMGPATENWIKSVGSDTGSRL